MFWFPNEFFVFTGECVKWFGEMTEMRDEFTIVTKKTKEALNFLKVLHGCLPFDDCVHFGFVYGDCAVFNEVSKVFDASCGEVAFGEFAIPVVFG